MNLTLELSLLERELLLTVDPRRRTKLQALWLVARGNMPKNKIAQITGIGTSTLRLMVKQYRHIGLACLEDQRKNNGRPRKIPDGHQAKNPKALKQLLEQQGIDVHLSTAFRFLQRQGILEAKVSAILPKTSESSAPESKNSVLSPVL